MLYTTVQQFNKLLKVPVLEAKDYTVKTCNAYLDNKGKVVKCGKFCPVSFN